MSRAGKCVAKDHKYFWAERGGTCWGKKGGILLTIENPRAEPFGTCSSTHTHTRCVHTLAHACSLGLCSQSRIGLRQFILKHHLSRESAIPYGFRICTCRPCHRQCRRGASVGAFSAGPRYQRANTFAADHLPGLPASVRGVCAGAPAVPAGTRRFAQFLA